MAEPYVELKHPKNRFMGLYMDRELKVLAELRYKGYIKDHYSDPELKPLMTTLASLERFDLAHHCTLYINGKYNGWAWIVTDKGKEVLEARKPRNYGCRCEYAIRMPCVCAESTFCPNPDHKGNGCHGTHD